MKAIVKSGVTLVECIVVIGVVGVLLAIMLPAIQSVRESVRRASCQNKLRQLTIASLSHHEAHRHFPISVSPFLEGSHPWPSRDGRGWIVSILAAVEQQSLYDRLSEVFGGDFLTYGGLRDPSIEDEMRTSLALLHCPSDGSVRTLSDEQWQWEGTKVALTSYKGVAGDNQMGGELSQHEGSLPDCLTTGECNGIFYRLTYQNPVRMSDVVDGAGQTFMIGEDVPMHNAHSVAFYANGDFASCHAPLNFFPKPRRPRDWWDVMSFRSYHREGANFAMVDGSIKFIADSIHHKTYQSLSTRNGSEVTSEF